MIITTTAIKGGTGKTTTALALAQAAARDGKKVLVVDLDSQCNISYLLGANTTTVPTVNYLLYGLAAAADTIQETALGIDVIAGNVNLAVETSKKGSAGRLKRGLEPLRNSYDLIVIDTPPLGGELLINALVAADQVLIPVQADILSLQSLPQTINVINKIRDTNAALKYFGILITNYNARSNISRYSHKAIQDFCAAVGAPYLMAIRQGIAAVQAAQNQQISLFEYAPKSKPAQDYLELYTLLQSQSSTK